MEMLDAPVMLETFRKLMPALIVSARIDEVRARIHSECKTE
jgi:hypothetical protein